MTVVAEVVRNGFVEGVHHGRVVSVDAQTGRIGLRIGDTTAPMLPRSALKPFQTAAMLDLGWQADDEQVAIACASHSGEAPHLRVVRGILDDAGLDENALDNTPGLPLDEAAAHDLIRAGGHGDSMHQNCSGKHAAMLATCVTNDWPTAGYRSPDHPLQIAIRASIEATVGEQVAMVAVDGCGAPAFAVSLAGLATGFVSLATAADGTALHRTAAAMRQHPFLVGGTGRDVTVLMQSRSDLVVKDGAEGVIAVGARDGVGIAVKIDDGAGRPRMPVLVAALQRTGYDVTPFVSLATTPVLGHGEPVGEVRATLPD